MCIYIVSFTTIIKLSIKVLFHKVQIKISTIFKTFNLDIKNATTSLGMFNKSFWAMKQDLAHGHGIGFSIFGGQGTVSSDKQAILNLNEALKQGTPPAKAWATTMSNASISV